MFKMFDHNYDNITKYIKAPTHIKGDTLYYINMLLILKSYDFNIAFI